MKLFKQWKSHFSILLIHPNEVTIWIELDENHNYHLPDIEINQSLWINDISLISTAIKKKHGIAVNILHYESLEIDHKQKEIKGIYVVEAVTIPENFNHSVWCSQENIRDRAFDNLKYKSIIESYLLELETNNIPELRPPWTQIGWYEKASNWIESELRKLNSEENLSIECIKSWSISCVLKIETNKNTFYLKQASTLPLFCDEPVVTKELANLFPNHIPKIVSINQENHWLLLQDFGEPIADKASLKIKQNVYNLLAQIQISSIEHREHLLNIGCLDRSLKVLQSQIDPLIEKATTLSELSREEIIQLKKLAPSLRKLCLQLASYNIPETLVHGDLHLGNIAINQGNYIIFDWTDSCISHPFFDLFNLFFTGKYQFWLKPFKILDKYYIYPRFKEAYLSNWLKYESKEHLLEAWEISKPLCALHHAVTYQHIVKNLELRSKSEFSNALPQYIREVIQSAIKLKIL